MPHNVNILKKLDRTYTSKSLWLSSTNHILDVLFVPKF